jgi:hypothetical protein
LKLVLTFSILGVTLFQIRGRKLLPCPLMAILVTWNFSLFA